MRNPFNPPPAPPGFGQNTEVPEQDASILSRLVFSWLAPFLNVGFSRPLEKEDLWQLPNGRLTSNLSNTLEANFYKRCPPDRRPASYTCPEATVDDDETLGPNGSQSRTEKKSKKKEKYDSSLLMATHQTFLVPWWTAGALKLAADTLKTTTPLLNKVLLTWLTTSFVYYHATAEQIAEGTVEKPHGIGYGVGLAFGLFIMQEAASLMTNHFSKIAMTTGLCLRTSLIGAIFRKSLRLSNRARIEHSIGQITTMISTDAARIDLSAAYLHNLWVAPIQIAIGVGLLIQNLGYSALVGLGVLLFGFPLQMVLMRFMFDQRKAGVAITDSRVRLTTEILSGIRLIKLYAWEKFYAHKVDKVRVRELTTIGKAALARATLISLVAFIPVLATVLSFITFALTGHDLNVAVIFSSLQIFNIIRMPLLLFPAVIAAGADALVALRRISTFLQAEELMEAYTIQEGSAYAVNVDGDFTWEIAHGASVNSPPKSKAEKGGEKKNKEQQEVHELSRLKKCFNGSKASDGAILPTNNSETSFEKEVEEERPFELKDLKLKIPKGAFVAIVGKIGSGKSSLLQAMIGEMRRTRGSAIFSSPIAYVPQVPWIMNATLRDNIIFGHEDDEERLREIVEACCLERDLEMLPQGEQTEIGEKGINLSGGQKARVSLARAAYSGADIILMDDSLSAVDAYVGKRILENCLLSGPLAGKTRVLATHALHVLDKTDYIYVVDNGVIAEQGTYKELMNDSMLFSRLIQEYGSLEKEEEEEKEEQEEVALKDEETKKAGAPAKKATGANHLMQAEERVTGSVAYSTYAKYFRYAGGVFWAPVVGTLLVLLQGSQVANNIFLGLWTSQSIQGFSEGDYMGTYAALGVSSAVFTFFLGFAVSLLALFAGLHIFQAAFDAVLGSPVSFFDTTPLGRIISRLSKDQDTLDSQMASIATQLLNNFSSVIGTAVLIFYTFPYLGIMFAPLIVLYYAAATYYRRSSVETKRLDSLMRSALYSSYSETLTGLSTVRGYGEQDRFIHSAEAGLDLENRAYYMTITIQRWLGIRLDLLGNFLILGIALFAAGFRKTVNPSKTGVVLSYTLSITQIFSDLVSQYAQNEQNFNAAERVLYYTELPSEGDKTTPNDPPPSWPENGVIQFNNVELSYRPGLPLVLKGVSFRIRPGEKVGIVGRTGAGKSSLLQALFRIVNVQSGEIIIDGHNIANIGLDVLRTRLALVPQDTTLFRGTLRENLDPQATRTDTELISALQRAWLLPPAGAPEDPVATAKFNLDASVTDEGSNYSTGEKQLLALCRALVKNSKIIVLDEATSSVDVETDSKLQQTIQTEFSDSTLLCIAHRLNTIVYYDRILVMDAGKVAEFDTPLRLFDKEDSIFRSLCDEANLARQDILRIRAGVVPPSTIPSSSSS
ncbi:ATP-binding cassette transporter C [Abortiporus biennis]